MALIFSLILCFGLVAPVALADQSGLRIPEQVTGDKAWAHVEYFSEIIGARPTETAQEAMAQDYIMEQFESFGYEVEVQEFSFHPWWSDAPFNSKNIIATKPGKIDQTVIIGAHYDSICGCATPYGADDNATGTSNVVEAVAAAGRLVRKRVCRLSGEDCRQSKAGTSRGTGLQHATAADVGFRH